MEIKRNGSQDSGKGPAEYFTGAVRVDLLFSAPAPARVVGASAADHDINSYLNLLGLDGNLTLVGEPAKPPGVNAFALIVGDRSLSGSNIGGIPEMQGILDFCGANQITADVEVIPIQKVNEAYERLLGSDVKHRFSIEMASLRSE